jgi:hypothetical protein
MTIRSLVLAITVTLTALGTSGCAAQLRATTSGKIGCPEQEVTISDVSPVRLGPATWTATCRGKRFYCSQTSTGKESADISCTSEMAAQR